jgi:putative transposase
MPQSFACLYYHLVFSTKHRQPLITPDLQLQLFDYLGGLIQHRQAILVTAGGTADHLHLLATIHKTQCLTDFMRELKGESSRWIHESYPHLGHFAWQTGYGAFSLSYPGLSRVKGYIAKQEEHHRAQSFQDEFRDFLRRHNQVFDERYLWE